MQEIPIIYQFINYSFHCIFHWVLSCDWLKQINTFILLLVEFLWNCEEFIPLIATILFFCIPPPACSFTS